MAFGRGKAGGWTELTGPRAHDVWRGPATGWQSAGDVSLNPADPRPLVGKPGRFVFVPGSRPDVLGHWQVEAEGPARQVNAVVRRQR